ncbi:MAG: TonB C-terminal domain-containing protein, partial [Kiritimatiellae bacterium]|nr:TonB C-terminal domain-containing protein [Kiritimatiellia bacterium]
TNKIVRREAPKPPPQAPALTAEQIRQQLLQGLPGTTPTTPSSANASVLGSYLAVVQNALYAAWQKPGGVAGRRVTVQIRIARDGSMIQRKLVGSSGDATLDESVMTALQSVRKFSAIPASYTDPFLDVTIHFESTGVSL